MKRIRQGWNTLRRNKRSGVSLIVALCAVAVLIGLSLSIVYSSSMLLSRANRKIGRERCYQLAQSFAQVLDSDLQKYQTANAKIDPTNYAPADSFYCEVNNIIYEEIDGEESGYKYDPDKPEETTAYYSAGSTDDDYGKITVLLRDVTYDSKEPEGKTFDYNERYKETEIAENQTFNRHQVSVGVKVEKGADSYTYTTEYRRMDTFEPDYVWQGEDGVSFKVYWVNDHFSRSSDGAVALEPQIIGEGEDAHREDVKISYTYGAKPKLSQYEPTYKPATRS